MDNHLYGPDSAVWRFHSDFSSLVGGLRALVVQSLEPRALAGVVQFSRLTENPEERLSETIDFVNVVTFGTLGDIEEAIAHVKALHKGVAGTDPVTGLAFSADDPLLLGFVHNALVESVATAYRSFHPHIGAEVLDQYVLEMTKFGALMGVPQEAMPTTFVKLSADIWRFETLTVSEEVLRSMDVLANLHLSGILAGRLYPQVLSWIMDSLPVWVQESLGHRPEAVAGFADFVILSVGGAVGEVLLPMSPRERLAREHFSGA